MRSLHITWKSPGICQWRCSFTPWGFLGKPYGTGVAPLSAVHLTRRLRWSHPVVGHVKMGGTTLEFPWGFSDIPTVAAGSFCCRNLPNSTLKFRTAGQLCNRKRVVESYCWCSKFYIHLGCMTLWKWDKLPGETCLISWQGGRSQCNRPNDVKICHLILHPNTPTVKFDIYFLYVHLFVDVSFWHVFWWHLINVSDVGPRGSLSDVGWFMSQMSFRIGSGHLKAGPIGRMSWP